CNNVSVQGDSLVASCRRADGREDRTSLAGFRRCVGDIGNSNGMLQCSTAGGGQLHGQVMAGPGPGPGPGPGDREGYPAPGYGAAPAPVYGAAPAPVYGAAPAPGPGYGAPPPGWERARWERCHEWHERAEDIRVRLERTGDPYERGRLEGRLQETRE